MDRVGFSPKADLTRRSVKSEVRGHPTKPRLFKRKYWAITAGREMPYEKYMEAHAAVAAFDQAAGTCNRKSR